MRSRHLWAAFTALVLIVGSVIGGVSAAKAWYMLSTSVSETQFVANAPTQAMSITSTGFNLGFSTVRLTIREGGGWYYWQWKNSCTGSVSTLSDCGIDSFLVDGVSQTPTSVTQTTQILNPNTPYQVTQHYVVLVFPSIAQPTQSVIVNLAAGALTTPSTPQGAIVDITFDSRDLGMSQGMTVNATVTFHPNGAPGSNTQQYGLYWRSLDPNPFVYSGYTFSGWATSSNSNVVAYTDQSGINITGNTDLYAVWAAIPQPNKTVTFHPNGAPGADSTQSTNTATALTANPFSNPGYTFQGWSTSNSSNAVAYQDTDQYAFSSDIDLYAVWTPVPTVASASVIVIQAQPMLANTGMNSSLPIGIAIVLAASGVGLLALKRRLHSPK